MMTLTDRDFSRDELSDLVRDHLCAECNGQLTLAWGQPEDDYWGYYVRCGRNRFHTGITRWDWEYQERKERVLGMESKTLTKMDERQMVERVNMARFPKDLSPDQKKMIAKVAIEYGLDPLMGELMMYQGNPYVRIDGRRRKAQESGQFAGISSRPATKDEREAREVPPGDYLYKAEVRRKGSDYTFDGWGKVTKAEVERAMRQAEAHKNDPYSLPIVKDPGDMAEKRAEAEALKRAFNLPLPSFEDLTFEQADAKAVQPGQAEEKRAPAEAVPPALQKKQEGDQGRNPETITSWTILMSSCFADFSMQPSDVYKELGVNNQTELRDGGKTPAQCYIYIRSMRTQ